MPIFILLTQVSPDALHQPKSLQTLEHHVADQVRTHCPEVHWLHSYAITGPWDYLDVFEAPDFATAVRVSVLVRSHGRSRSEVWPALAWPEFKSMVRALPGRV
jgi:uncharacterized protein with GYD domain